MNDLMITINMILAICGGISVIGGGVAVIIKLISPIRKMKGAIHENAVAIHNDEIKLGEIEECDKVICQCLLAILDHNITNNSIDKLKAARKNLQDFLIER